jgi:glycosyltransferase involved in cell wall biosynthesis
MKDSIHQPLVSIGIPVYNGEASIERTIRSLLSQDYKNLELIISDNGSTDSTPSIVEMLAQKYPSISFFRSDQNQGLIWNFNRVFELSKGEYFMWASHDDAHSENYVSRCLQELQIRPSAALCAPSTVATLGKNRSEVWVSHLGSFLDKTELKSRYSETLKNFPAVALYGLYRSSFVRKTCLLPKVMGGDLLFIQNLSIYGELIGFDEILFTYHQRDVWNTVSQDYCVFFGDQSKPKWYLPFAVTSYWQIKLVFRASISNKNKLQLLSTLFAYQSKSFLQKIGLKLIRYLVPEPKKTIIGGHVYWRYLHNPNLRVLNMEKFEERIVKPTLNLSRR